MTRAMRTTTMVAVISFGLSASQNVVTRAQGAAALPWMNTSLPPEQRADLLIAQMTLEQKVEQISNDVTPAKDAANRPPGCGFEQSGRHIQGIPELGIPTVRMTNGGTGVRSGDCSPSPTSTELPSTVALAATFNPALATELGDILGDETRLAGHQVLLGPGLNLARHPYSGRNYQNYSEDPYLSGLMAADTIEGIQAHGIHATPKHFVGNEQETKRKTSDSVIPPRALHELYLLPFEMAVKDAQPAAIMCAYNELNGVPSCSNQELLTTTLRQQWGFGGYVITDRSAVHDVAPSIKAGLDWELAHIEPVQYTLDNIKAALQAGSITISDIDQMLRRRYIQMFKFGQFDTNFDALFGGTPDFVSHGLTAREIAEQSIVLLKNQNSVLPLNAAAINSVALIGPTWFAGMAKLAIRGTSKGPYSVTPQEGLVNVLRQLGSTATVKYESGSGGRAGRDQAVALAKKSDVVIVMVGDNPHEGCDRDTLQLPIIPPADPNFCGWNELKPGEYDVPPPPPRGKGTNQEALMKALAGDPEVAKKMVVVLKTEGMVLMPWLDKVPALVEAWYPGQEDGNVVADVLFGLRNPSGKLPVTFGNSAREAAYATPEQFPGVWSPPPPWSKNQTLSPQYSEDLQVGYRWYEANSVTPLFPFGFGLSYTTFAYSALSAATTVDPTTGHAVLSVTYTITNTGSRDGAEASQVYLTLPPAAGEPSKRLVGFQKVDLPAGGTQTVTVTIDPSASNHPLSFWVPGTTPAATPATTTPATTTPATSEGTTSSVNGTTADAVPGAGWSQGSWSTPLGDYVVLVGTSSADTSLQQSVTIAASPDATGCTAAAPASDWVCVAGGWFPPVAPVPAPTPGPPPGPPPVAGVPQLFTIDAPHLVNVRDSLKQGDTQFQSALNSLVADANSALRIKPMSVMNKAVTPPSGDKHDYMSQAPYWWPNPSKPRGLPYIRKDGQRNPEINRITDRANLGRLANATETLGLAFFLTGRDEYAQHAAQLVRVWFLDPATKMNPNLNFGQRIPGVAPGRPAGIIETRLLPTILDGVMLLQGSSAWTASDDAGLKMWMSQYLQWLLESRLGREEATKGNNQETWDEFQRTALALYTGQTDVARAALLAARDAIGREFEPDGRQPRELARTKAWDYSIFNLTAFAYLAEMGQQVGVDLWHYSTPDGRSLKAGIDFLVPFATGAKKFPYKQIGGFRPTELYPLLRRAAIGLNDQKYNDMAQQIGSATPRLTLTLRSMMPLP